MAHRDDVVRVLAACEECSSIYAARKWPDGDVRLIGQQRCECGSTEFVTVDDTDSPSERSEGPAGE